MQTLSIADLLRVKHMSPKNLFDDPDNIKKPYFDAPFSIKFPYFDVVTTTFCKKTSSLLPRFLSFRSQHQPIEIDVKQLNKSTGSTLPPWEIN